MRHQTSVNMRHQAKQTTLLLEKAQDTLFLHISSALEDLFALELRQVLAAVCIYVEQSYTDNHMRYIGLILLSTNQSPT